MRVEFEDTSTSEIIYEDDLPIIPRSGEGVEINEVIYKATAVDLILSDADDPYFLVRIEK